MGKMPAVPGAKAEKESLAALRKSSGHPRVVERQDAANRMMEEYRRIRYDEGEERRL